MKTSLPLTGSSILVVEGKDRAAWDVRSALVKLGAKVHVVNNAEAGLMIARRKRLHGAILDCVNHGASLPLCTELALGGVPFMFYGGGPEPAADVADSMSDLISIDNCDAVFARRLHSIGSGEDWHRV